MKRSILAIAGSDSSGGAGLQADLRTFAAFGLHGLSVVTVVTAQNSRAVKSVLRMPAAMLRAQLRSVFDEFAVRAVKIGMLGSSATVDEVAASLREFRARNIVLDPVMAASSGAALLPARAIRRLRTVLMPLCALVTPNVPEAEALLGRRLRSDGAMRDAAHELLDLGARAVLLKGGHRRGSSVRDYLVTANGYVIYSHARLAGSARGTGCTLASAVACGLAAGLALPAAIDRAEQFLQQALRHAYRPGRGSARVLDTSRSADSDSPKV